MGLNHGWRGPNIVRDGLVLYLDAGSPNSYQGSGTTWKDISKFYQNDGTLTNGPTFSSDGGGSIVFDGVDDYVTTPLTTQFNDFTVCVWFKQVGSIIGYQRLLDKNYIDGFWLGRSSTTSNSWGGGIKETSFPFGRFITLSDGSWHYIVSQRQGNTHNIFGDGITNTVSGTVTSDALSNSTMLVGRSDQVGLDSMTGNISLVQIYNRAITTSEILQNYNATKGRFGL